MQCPAQLRQCYGWAAPPATCPLHSLLLEDQQGQNTFVFTISTCDSVSLLLLPLSTQGGGGINPCPILDVHFFSWERSLLYSLSSLHAFLGLSAISPNRAGQCFHTEGLPQCFHAAGWGVHSIHLRRASMHLLCQQLPYNKSSWAVLSSSFLQGSTEAGQFSRLDEASLGSPSKSRRDPFRCHGWALWCINQPQDYDESPVWHRCKPRW